MSRNNVRMLQKKEQWPVYHRSFALFYIQSTLVLSAMSVIVVTVSMVAVVVVVIVVIVVLVIQL